MSGLEFIAGAAYGFELKHVSLACDDSGSGCC